AVLIPAAPTIRNRPLAVDAVSPRTVLRPRPLIGPDAAVFTHDASAPGADCRTRSVETCAAEPSAALRCWILKMPALRIAVWVRPPEPIRRPSTVEAIDRRP